MLLYRIGLVIVVSCLHFFAFCYLAQTGTSRHIEKPMDISVQLLSLPHNQPSSSQTKKMVVAQPKPTSVPAASLPATSTTTSTNQESKHVDSHTESEYPSSGIATKTVQSSTVSAVESSNYQEPRSAAYLNNPKPEYPTISRRLQETGKVLLRVHVDTSGMATQVEIRNSSGFPRLDNAAVKAVWQWRFVPAKRGETTVAAWVLIPLNFELNS